MLIWKGIEVCKMVFERLLLVVLFPLTLVRFLRGWPDPKKTGSYMG